MNNKLYFVIKLLKNKLSFILSDRKFWSIIGILILIRTIMVFALINGVPETPWHHGWYLYHGGDQIEYFRLAYSIALFNPVSSQYPMGLPLLLVPLIYLFNATTFQDILAPGVILHSVVLFNLSIILVALITKTLFKNKLIAIISAILWTILPYLVYLTLIIINPIMADPPSVFFILLSVYLYLLSKKKKEAYPIMTGISVGFSMLIRLTNMIMPIFFVFAYIYHKKYKYALYFAIATLLVFSPQLIYNYYFYNMSPTFGYGQTQIISFNDSSTSSIIKIEFFYKFLNQILKDKYLPLLAIGLFFLILSFISSYKKNLKSTIFLSLWILTYTIFYSFSAFGFLDPIRYLMPIYPAVIILISSLIYDVIISLHGILTKYGGNTY